MQRLRSSGSQVRTCLGPQIGNRIWNANLSHALPKLDSSPVQSLENVITHLFAHGSKVLATEPVQPPSSKRITFPAICGRINPASVCVAIRGVISIPIRQQIRKQIENLLLIQRVEQARRHQ